MNHEQIEQGYGIYPAKYFGASPTFNRWCKTTIADVHALRDERGFEGQNVFFHLNHPIRFITLVGVITAIDDVNNSAYTKLTLDDGSGADVDLKVTNINRIDFGTTAIKDVKDMTIRRGVGEFVVKLGASRIDVGTVVKVKGTISIFREVRQLELKRIWVVKNTNEEAEMWKALGSFRVDVLAKPWILTTEDRERVDNEMEEEGKRRRKDEKKTRLKREARGKHEKERLRERESRDARAEKRRLVLEREMNAGALV